MNYGHAHMPVILLLENGQSVDGKFIRQWLSESRFSTFEAFDAFEVLEEISDFTMRDRPEVIILNVESAKNDLGSIRDIVKCGADCDDLAIISMTGASPSGKDDFYATNVRQIEARLEKLLPAASVMSN